MNKIKVGIRQLLAGWLLVLGGAAFAERATAPEGLVDLTDDTSNRASISGTDDLRSSNGANAFNLIGDVASQVAAATTDANNNGRFGGQKNKPIWVSYDFVTPQIVNAYRIYNQHAAGFNVDTRSPKEFTLEGSQTGETDSWTVLDSETETTAWSGLEARYFTFKNTTAYKFYRLQLKTSQSDIYVIIQQVELFYVVEGDSLTVMGAPAAYGKPSPAYGVVKDAVAETAYDFSIETPIVLTEDKQVAVCVGWAASQKAEDEWTEFSSGTGNAANFTYPGGICKFEWQFVVSNKVDAAVSGEGCTVSGAGWYEAGKSLTLKATAAEDYMFIRWLGDTDGIADTSAAEITLVADSPRTLTAFFVSKVAPRVQYVSPEGNDENMGDTQDTAKATLAAAVSYLDSVFMEGTVFVAPGTYKQAKELVISNAIEIVGLTGHPEDVRLQNTKSDQSVLILKNAKAFVSGVVMENGIKQNGAYGGNLKITDAGGTVSNCIIRSGWGWGPNGGNVALLSPAALVTHCVISNAQIVPKNSCDGTAVIITKEGGRLSNCLITKNGPADSPRWEQSRGNNSSTHVVTLKGGSMDNCTIVDNCHTGLTTVVYAYPEIWGGTVRVYNCVIAGNTTLDGTRVVSAGSGHAANFFNCVTDDEEPLNDTCKVGTLTDMFEDYARGNYRPKVGSVLQNMGTLEGFTAPAKDLAGLPRVMGKAIDVGCYECQKTKGFLLLVR